MLKKINMMKREKKSKESVIPSSKKVWVKEETALMTKMTSMMKNFDSDHIFIIIYTHSFSLFDPTTYKFDK